MGKQNVISSNFTSGEVSPLLRGRVDVNRYANGVEELENFIAVAQGAALKRTGTEFIRATKLSTGAILVPFKFSDQQAYQLELGDGYIHIYKDDKPLMETTTTEVERLLTINNGGSMQLSADVVNHLPGWGDIFNFYAATSSNGDITLTNNGGLVRVTTTVPHTLRTGVKVFMRSTEIAGINALEFTVTRISAYAVDLQGSTYAAPGAGNTAMFSHGLLPGDRFYITDMAAYPTLENQWHTVKSVENYSTWTVANVPYVNNGVPTGSEEAHTIPIEIVTPYAVANLANLRFFQTADVLYIVGPDYKPYTLKRMDNDGDRLDWLFSEADFIDGPYLPLNNIAPNIDSTTPANGSTYADVYLEVSAYAHTATVTSASDFTDATDDDGLHYLEYRVRDQWQLALINSAGIAGGNLRSASVTILDNLLLHIDETTKLKTTYSPGQVNTTPTIPVGSGIPKGSIYAGGFNNNAGQQRIDPNNEVASDKAVGGGIIIAGKITSQFSNTFSPGDVGKFVRVRDSGRTATGFWVKVLSLSSTSGGSSANHGQSVPMATNQTTGQFIVSAETRTCTVKSFKAGVAFDIFNSGDVGRHIRLGFTGRWTWGKIATVVNAHEVTVALRENMPLDPDDGSKIAGNQLASATNSGITYDWRLGAFAERGSGTILGPGWPACGCFHEQRLFLARTDAQPDAIYTSVSGSFNIFSPTELDSTVLDDSGFYKTIASGEVNSIQWLLSSDVLLVGTIGGIYMMSPASIQNDPLTPTNANVRRGLSHGTSILVQPVIAGNSVLFAQLSGRKIREAAFADDVTFGSRLVSKDLTVVSEPMTKRGLTAIQAAWQEEPHGIYWVLLSDGTLSAMTYNKEQEVVAWHHHEISANADYDAFADVESISVIPSSDSTREELWMVVKRTISGVTKRYIEKFAADWLPASVTDRDSMPFMDSHLMFNFSPAQSPVEGLTHLEGVNVDIVADGHNIGNLIVTGGTVDIDDLEVGATAENVVIGCTYHPRIKSLPPEGGSNLGTSQGQIKRIVFLDARLLNSLTIQYGFEDLSRPLDAVSDDTGTTGLSGNGSLFTGTKRLVTNHGYDPEGRWVIEDAFPYPLNVICMVTKLETNE